MLTSLASIEPPILMIMNQLNFAILMSKLASPKLRESNLKTCDVLGVTHRDALTIAAAINNGVNVYEQVKKFTLNYGCRFLDDSYIKSQFITSLETGK